MQSRSRMLSPLAVCALSLFAQPQAPPDDARHATFEMIWQTVKEKHFDPSFGGLDWDAVRAKYEPKISGSRDSRAFHRLMQQMVDELGQSHFSVVPPEAVVEIETSGSSEGVIGIDIQIHDGQAMIMRVREGSPAARAGLKPGYLVDRVGSTSSRIVIDRVAKSTERLSLQRARAGAALAARTRGEPGTPLELSVIREGNEARTVTVDRETRQGEMSPRLGNFPPQPTEFEFRRLANGASYVRFNIFVMSLMERIRTAILESRSAPGLILDLRGNPGGVAAMAGGIAGIVESAEGSLGTMRMRSGYLRMAVFPQPRAFDGPLVILVDHASMSTTEILAAGLQEHKRAVVIGERSGGAALPSMLQQLPSGGLFQFAMADFKTPAGALVEGRGVTPDIEVKLDRAALLAGRDPQLERSIEYIDSAQKLGRSNQ